MTTSVLGPDLLGSAVLRRQLPGLPAALDADAMRGRLQRLLVGPRHVVEECVPGKVWYRGERGCDLRYELGLRDRAGGGLVAATVLGRVLPDAGAAEAYRRARVDPLVPGLRRGLGALRVAAACVPELGLVVHVFPVDPALPTLVAATDPGCVRSELRAVLGWSAGDCAVRVVRHARGGRCVLRYCLGGSRVVYGKVYADAAGGSRQDLLAALHGAAGGGGVRVPGPLGYAAGLRMSLCDVVPGRAADLADPGERAGGVVAAARAAAALHRVGVRAPAARSLAGEMAALRGELAAIGVVWPGVVARLAAVLAGVRAEAGGVPALPPVFCHGDLTPAQVLLDPSGVGVVDFDAAVAGEPALDLGRFLAYLRFALAKRGSGAAPALRRAFLAAYVEAAGHRGGVEALAARVALYERLSLVRLAARACLQLKTGRLRTALSLLPPASPLSPVSPVSPMSQEV